MILFPLGIKLSYYIYTKVIREKGFTNIPIIALTAHANEGCDKAACLDAGMNDYITKPIKRELVLNILKKWIF